MPVPKPLQFRNAGKKYMDPIYIFGFRLAELTHQKDFSGIGLLCLAIKDSGREYKNLTYDDFRNIILTYLPRRMEKMNYENCTQITEALMTELNQNQSIFTLSSH